MEKYMRHEHVDRALLAEPVVPLGDEARVVTKLLGVFLPSPDAVLEDAHLVLAALVHLAADQVLVTQEMVGDRVEPLRHGDWAVVALPEHRRERVADHHHQFPHVFGLVFAAHPILLKL